MKCFYHTDSDGKCAGFWVRRLVGEKFNGVDEYLPINYNQSFPLETIKEKEIVYIVDFSIHPDVMRELLKITPNVIWIDHHKTAIEKYDGFEVAICGLRVDGIAGCELTYMFLMLGAQTVEMAKEFREQIPLFTRMIGDRDVWKFELGDATRLFHMGLNMEDHNPKAEIWDALYDEKSAAKTMADLMKDGHVARKWRDRWAVGYVKAWGAEFEFEGHRCYGMNLAQCGSEFFEAVMADDYDILIPFAYSMKQKNWRISLFSGHNNRVDVGEIAKKYGGGGHKGAAGFICDIPPWMK